MSTSEFEPRSVKDALENKIQIEAMNEEIEQIEKNKTWTLVPRPKDKKCDWNKMGIQE